MSLRTRILLLVLLSTFAPAAALAFYLFAQRDREIDKAGRSLGAQAVYTAEILENRIKGTVQLLHGLSRAPDLDTPIRPSCSDFLAEVLARYPQYTGLLTITPTGELHCDSLRTGRALNVSERAYFKQVKATLHPAFDVVFGGLTGIAVLQVAYPVLNGSGELKYVLLASLNLSQFARSVVSASEGREMMMLLWNRDGVLMAREPDVGSLKLAGKALPNLELFRFTRAGKLGETAELTGPGGRRAIWALGTLPEPHGSGLRVNLGVRRDVLVAEADKGLTQALYLLAGATLLALMGALLVAEFGIRRHATRIMRVAARMGAGDLDARIGAPYPRGELGDLMTVIDHTAGAVQAQQAEIKAKSRNLERSNRMLRMLSGINSTIVRVRTQDELFREACRIAVEAGQFRLAWIGILASGGDAVVLAASAGETRGIRNAFPARVSASEGAPQSIVGQAIARRKDVVIDDIRNDGRVGIRQQLEESGIRSGAVLPLMLAGEPVGVLALHAAEPGFFDGDEMALLRELAGDIAFALDHIQKSERLDYLAYYDPLTGLANSAKFHDRLAGNVAAAASANRRFAVLVIDIERFKSMNDTLGRAAGDELLRQFAKRLVLPTGEANRFARVGVDRFALVSTAVKDENDVLRLVEQRRAQCLGAPFRIGGIEQVVTVKVGVAWYPNDGTDAASVFRNAESALKEARATGAGLLFYDRKMTDRITESLALEKKLRQALERNEFVLHYQPKVDAINRSIVGVEALIRWQSPELGLVPPIKFIPFLEESGLIVPVGTWALKQAARDHHAWLEAGLPAPRVAVNVSAIQLRQAEFVSIVAQSIAEGAATSGIDLEVTESVLMDDIQGYIAKLTAVQKLGVQVAMDDFGTGYSSLAYLARLPLQALKIDRAFISTMLENSDTMTLVSTMISLGHSLRLKVIAEGVETEEQAKMLRLLRCDEMQGYLISKPLPVKSLVELLRSDAQPAISA